MVNVFEGTYKNMGKLYSSIFIIILCISLYFGTTVLATPSEADNARLILIDAGHGGRDGGAVSINGILEKHINLSISLKVREKLEALGYEVMMTRWEDKDLYSKSGNLNTMKREDLNARCRMKRDSNCDLFISIHQNYFKQASCKGAQIWYSKNNESKRFANMLQENLKKDLGNNKREEKAANNDYKILRCYTNIPSVIVECGFLSNSEEEKKLITSEYQEKIASSIVKTIEEYYAETLTQ